MARADKRIEVLWVALDQIAATAHNRARAATVNKAKKALQVFDAL